MLSNVFSNSTILGVTESVVTAASASIVAVILSWTAIIVYHHRSKWRTLDTLIFLLILQSITNQIITLLYSSLVILQPVQEYSWCPGISWLLASSHTLQAGTLTTLALSVLLRTRMPQIKYKKTLSKSHLAYHCFCLFLLSCCVGVATILAQNTRDYCFPHHDKRYLTFYLVLHSSLILASFFSLVYSCTCQSRISNSSAISTKNLLLNSSSDLSSAFSDISMISSTKSRNFNNNKICYSVSNCSFNGRNNPSVETLLQSPTYNIHTNIRGERQPLDNYFHIKNSNCQQPKMTRVPESSDLYLQYDTDNSTYPRGYINGEYNRNIPSYISSGTSGSSTNSRSRCYSEISLQQDVCLATISAIVCMSYFVNHLPILISTLMAAMMPEYLPTNWPQKTFPLWAALAEGCLFPVVLYMFDEQFSRRVAGLYKTSSSPDKGVYGKFRPYNGSLMNPSSGNVETVMRFPLTNGSLFTSSNGGLPIVHVHRRPRGIYKSAGPLPQQTRNQRQWFLIKEQRPNIIQAEIAQSHPNARNNNDSVNSDHFRRSETNYVKENDRVDDCGVKDSCFFRSNLAVIHRLSSRSFHPQCSIKKYPEDIQRLRGTLFLNENGNSCYDSAEEYGYDSENEEPIYATLSTHSTCSATTAANDDFEFFRHSIASSQNQTKSSNNCPNLKRGRSVTNKQHAELQSITRSSFTSQQTYAKKRKYSFIQENSIPKTNADSYHDNVGYHHDWYKPFPLPLNSKFRHSIHPIEVLRKPGANQFKPRLSSMLSVDSLVDILNERSFSYLDTGDLYQHPSQMTCSVPDLKKVFITDFL